MKLKDLNDLKNKTAGELVILVAKKREEIVKATMDMAKRKSKNTNIARNLKKDLAQILTLSKNI